MTNKVVTCRARALAGQEAIKHWRVLVLFGAELTANRYDAEQAK
jgi:hypothetical protein